MKIIHVDLVCDGDGGFEAISSQPLVVPLSWSDVQSCRLISSLFTDTIECSLLGNCNTISFKIF